MTLLNPRADSNVGWKVVEMIILEASSIVESGPASTEDVDTAVKMGMGIRSPAWDPLEHLDGVCINLCTSVQNTVLSNISDSRQACNRVEVMLTRENRSCSKSHKDFSVRCRNKR